MALSELPFASVLKRVLVRNHSHENEFDLHENGRVGEAHFHMNGFARRHTRFDIEAKVNSEIGYTSSLYRWTLCQIPSRTGTLQF